jgi:photosystem II stability/assembly factor-like uncharacterized protein
MLKKKLLVLMVIFTITLTGCVSLTKKKEGPPPIPADGGFYTLGKDAQGNYTWSQDVYLATAGAQKPNFKEEDVTAMSVDPQDNKAIYVGTKKGGLFYTYDAGKNWFGVAQFKNQIINDVQVSYKNKCLIYLTAGSELYKSEDCSRTWIRMENDDRAGFYYSALAIDSYNEGVVYAGISLNELVGKDTGPDIARSADFAESRQVLYRFPIKNIVSKVVLDPKDTRIVYVATNNAGLYKSTDAGQNWEDITGVKQDKSVKAATDQNKEDVNQEDVTDEKQSKPVKGGEFVKRYEKLIDFDKNEKDKVIDSLIFRDMVILPDDDGTLVHASNYGLLKSIDGGLSWVEIKLIPPEGEKKAIIYSLASHPTNSQEFYYGSDDTLFRTKDGGENWTTIKGPGTRAIYNILVTENEKGDSNVYVGMYNLKPPAPKKK